MQTVPTLGLDAVEIKLLITGHAPNVGGYAVLRLENLLRAQRFVENRAASKQLRAQLRLRVWRRPEAVHPAQDAVLHVTRHDRHGIRFVHHGDVVEDAFAILIHAANPVLDDDRDFIRKRRIVSLYVRNRQREYMAIAVLVLQTFSPESSSSRSSTA